MAAALELAEQQLFGERALDVFLDDGYTKEDLLEAVPSARSVPQIFLDGEHVGGFTELRAKFLAEAA